MLKPMALLTRNSNQSVAAGGNVEFNNVSYITSAIGYQDGEILIKAPGIYKVAAVFVTTAVAADDQAITMMANGSAVPGARASESAATIGDDVTLSIVSAVKVNPAVSGVAAITFESLGATTIASASVVVEKVA